jgi:hypothetical protein
MNKNGPITLEKNFCKLNDTRSERLKEQQLKVCFITSWGRIHSSASASSNKGMQVRKPWFLLNSNWIDLGNSGGAELQRFTKNVSNRY